MTLVDWINVTMLSAMTLAVGYLYMLACFGIAGRKQYPELSKEYNFLIMIPAHNEERVIEETLISLSHLERVGRLQITVVADNCDDNTADVARSHAINVLERTSKAERGKGYALEWAISQYNLTEYSAVAVIDADTIVEPNMLKAMARSFETGAGAVQLFNECTPGDNTPLAHLQNTASVAENVFFYKGRSILQLPILLRGTGMAVRSDVLQSYPWDSHSVTEDVDYAVNILKHGVKIDFSPESTVRSPATSTYEQSYTQKERWVSGTFNLITDKMLPLIGTAVTKGRFDLMELAFSLLLLSRPTLIFANIVLLVVALFSSPELRPYLLAWPLVLIALLIAYLCSGVFFVQDKKTALKAFLQAPYYGIWLLLLQVRALIKRRRLPWARTKRRNL